MRTAGPGRKTATDDHLRLCLVDAAMVPDAMMRAAAGRLVDDLMQPNGQLVHNPAVIARSLGLVGLRLPLDARRRLAALAIREEKRSAIAAEQADTLDRLFAAQGIAAQPVRGWHFACRFYADPLVRHCHALRWLVLDPQVACEMESLVASAGWTMVQRAPLLAPHKRIRTGPDRIAVELHTRPFGWTALQPEPGCDQSAAFIAVELIGASITEMFAGNMRWAIDLVHLLRRIDVDADDFARQAARFGLAGYAGTALGRVTDLAHPDDTPLRSRLAALGGALAHAGLGDSAPVHDIELLKAMATGSRKNFVLHACRRPGLIAMAQRLRAERRARLVSGLAARTSLLQRVRNPGH